MRPHYLAPLKQVVPLFRNVTAGGSNWVINSMVRMPDGQVVRSLRFDTNTMPAACRPLVLQRGDFDACLSSHGFRQIVTYQPASRFWEFQTIELGVFLVFAGLLIASAFFLVTRRDA